MKTGKVHMDSLHMDHRLWHTELKFFQDELQIFSDWLGQVSQANSDTVVKIKVEQFQNRFYIQKMEIEKQLKQMKSHEAHLAEIAKGNTVASDHLLFTDHTQMRKEVEAISKMQSGMKEEFNRFVADHF